MTFTNRVLRVFLIDLHWSFIAVITELTFVTRAREDELQRSPAPLVYLSRTDRDLAIRAQEKVTR